MTTTITNLAIAAREIEELKNTIEQIKTGLDKRPLREPHRTASVGGGEHFAFCKTDAPEDDEIVCYLNTDVTGKEITVKCILFAATKLSDCVPRLLTHKRIIVKKMADGEWWSVAPGWYNDTVICGTPV